MDGFRTRHSLHSCQVALCSAVSRSPFFFPVYVCRNAGIYIFIIGMSLWIYIFMLHNSFCIYYYILVLKLSQIWPLGTPIFYVFVTSSHFFWVQPYWFKLFQAHFVFPVPAMESHFSKCCGFFYWGMALETKLWGLLPWALISYVFFLKTWLKYSKRVKNFL